MLSTVVTLYDIEDVEAFVQATLNGSGIRFEPEERDELVAEGLTIMYDLAERFEPRRAGYAQDGRFSGFAAYFLPRRLGDAWHRLHPEHCYVTRADGGREWVYLQAPVSLDGIRADARARGRGDVVDARILDSTQWVAARPTAGPPVPPGTVGTAGSAGGQADPVHAAGSGDARRRPAA